MIESDNREPGVAEADHNWARFSRPLEWHRRRKLGSLLGRSSRSKVHKPSTSVLEFSSLRRAQVSPIPGCRGPRRLERGGRLLAAGSATWRGGVLQEHPPAEGTLYPRGTKVRRGPSPEEGEEDMAKAEECEFNRYQVYPARH